MAKFSFLFVLIALTSVAGARAGELDPSPVAAPQGLIVQDDGHGNTQVFKADDAATVTSDASAAKVIANDVVAANKIANVVSASELDRTSSTESWYYWTSPVYYNPYTPYYYGYNYYGYTYNYAPYYNYYNSGNYYHYYRRW